MDRFVCVHGHFYQPPRENPWLGVIEIQDSASPYHDWNERVAADCYGPNARARILNDSGWIERIVNNYARLSFNFGPTLLSWLEEKEPEVYAAVLAADRESRERFSGHGSAIAQAFNHVILPLASSRDKRTQVLWGLADFEKRFGRRAEGMWLPETAVDIEALDILAERGISFVILAPHQAAKVREPGSETWTETADRGFDTSRPYRVTVPSGRTIAAFFYDGALARAVAFDRVLDDGREFARRLLDAAAGGEGPRLAHIATDGETYGHHHRFGEMALASALEFVQASGAARLTNYGEYLERFPPGWEAEIAENTSWSCPHGVERWRADCGCATGAHPGWRQGWRGPLRGALDWLRDRVAPLYETASASYFRDPWDARDAFVSLVLDRSPENVERFLREHGSRVLSPEERVAGMKLLELQRNAMLMFTSCGWFFDDLAGIETVQVLQYAGRVVQLAQDLFGDHLEPEFEERLAAARSNRADEGDGRRIYRRHVTPARVDLDRVAAHYAVTCLFGSTVDGSAVHGFNVEREDYHLAEAGRTRLAVGRVHVSSGLTEEAARLCFAAIHFGDQNIAGGVRPYTTEEQYDAMRRQVSDVFSRADFTEVIRAIDAQFPGQSFSLRSLFRDEQRRILGLIVDPALHEAETLYRSLYEEHIPLMRFLTSIGYPLPNRFRAAAEFALNIELRRAFGRDEIDREHVLSVLEEASLAGIEVDREGVAFVLQGTIERLAAGFAAAPGEIDACQGLLAAVELARDAGFPLDLWRTQNVFYDVLHGDHWRYLHLETADAPLQDWLELFVDLGAALRVAVT